MKIRDKFDNLKNKAFTAGPKGTEAIEFILRKVQTIYGVQIKLPSLIKEKNNILVFLLQKLKKDGFIND